MSDFSISNMFMPDGRDLDSVFYRGTGTQTLGFICMDGVDIGAKFVAGRSSIQTGYYAASGKDVSYYLLSTANLKLASGMMTIEMEGVTSMTTDKSLKFTGGSGKYKVTGVYLGEAVSGSKSGLTISGWEEKSGNTNPVRISVTTKTTGLRGSNGKVEVWATVKDMIVGEEFDILIGYVVKKQAQYVDNSGDDYSGGEQSTGDVDAEGESGNSSDNSGSSGSGGNAGNAGNDNDDPNEGDGSGTEGPGASGGGW